MFYVLIRLLFIYFLFFSKNGPLRWRPRWVHDFTYSFFCSLRHNFIRLLYYITTPSWIFFLHKEIDDLTTLKVRKFRFRYTAVTRVPPLWLNVLYSLPLFRQITRNRCICICIYIHTYLKLCRSVRIHVNSLFFSFFLRKRWRNSRALLGNVKNNFEIINVQFIDIACSFVDDKP